MEGQEGYRKIPLSFNRKMVRASASITRQKNAIHAVTEVDVSEPRRLIREHFDRTGEKLSFTAYIVTCLSQTLVNHPALNSFIRRGRFVQLDDITVSVLVERDLERESRNHISSGNHRKNHTRK
jgi:pyruvate/2-oxoglutarate dehydrogenase complex dihydrolipoamide acyltransferase (E2) component